MSTFGWSHRQRGAGASEHALVELKAGAEVTPKVRLRKPLGRGAMGEVWLADHLSLGTRVAVKFITAELAVADSEILERFQREARLAARINSPYVVNIHDFGVTKSGSPYIVMEYLEGESLGERLERTGWLSFDQIAQVVTQMSKALGAAHRVGVIHRDIKPDNIHLVPTDEGFLCKVLDFGIAKQTRQAGMRPLTEVNAMVGTPEFMSPEQIMNAKGVDHQADLWGLAVVAYCAVVGAIPFDGNNLGELCVSILNSQYKAPSTIRHECAQTDLDGWFQRAFSSDIQDRFASAQEMGLAFVRCLSSPPGHLIAELEQSGPFPAVPQARLGTVVGLGPPGGLPSPNSALSGYAGDTADLPTLAKRASGRSGARIAFVIAVVGAVLILGGAGLVMAFRPESSPAASLATTGSAEPASSGAPPSATSRSLADSADADVSVADAGDGGGADGADGPAAGSASKPAVTASASVSRPTGSTLVPIPLPTHAHGTKTTTDKEDPGF